MSIADMVREAAMEVLHSRVPEGFEWIEDYGQYYSSSCGFFYDPNTSLFYHSASQTYYIYNDETCQYEVYKCLQKVQWKTNAYKKKATQMFGEGMEKLDQDGVDVCEVVFKIIDRLCWNECPTSSEDEEDKKTAKDSKRHRKKMSREQRGRERILRMAMAMEQSVASTSDMYFDVESGEMVDRNRRNVKKTRDELDAYSNESDDSSRSRGPSPIVHDEREQMMAEEGFTEAPLLRIMSSENVLSIVTICGGFIGSSSGCDVHIEDSDVPGQYLQLVFDAESGAFYMKQLCVLESVIFVVNEQLFEENRPVEHGDVLRIVTTQGEHIYRIHVHYGNNTCTSCEPGLLASNDVAEARPKYVKSNEKSRRQMNKMIKESYGITDHEPDNLPRGGNDRAAKRRKMIGSQHGVIGVPSTRVLDPNDIHAGCAAKPIPGVVVTASTSAATVVVEKKLSQENKGFKLLKSMGWKEGTGLGKTEEGRVEPVSNELKNNRAGLGAKEAKTTKPKTWKDSVMEKTKERFDQISKEEQQK